MRERRGTTIVNAAGEVLRYSPPMPDEVVAMFIDADRRGVPREFLDAILDEHLPPEEPLDLPEGARLRDLGDGVFQVIDP